MLLSGILLTVLTVEVLLLIWLGSSWVDAGASVYLVIAALLFAAALWRSAFVLLKF